MTRLATQRTGAKLKWAGITDEAQLCQPPCSRICSVVRVVPQGKLDVEEFKRLLSPKTKMVAFVHISNTLGCINPVSQQCQCQDCWIMLNPCFPSVQRKGSSRMKDMNVRWMSDECHVVPYLAEHCDHRCPRYAGCLKWSPVRSKRWRTPRMPWEPRLESLSCMGQGHNSNNGPQVGCRKNWKWCAYDWFIDSLIGCLDGSTDSTVDSGSLIDSLCVLLTGWIWMHPDGEVLLDACQSVPHLKIEAWPHVAYHIPHIATAACAMWSSPQVVRGPP